MNVEELTRIAVERLSASGSTSAALDAGLLLEKVTGKSRLELFTYNLAEISDEHETAFEELISRREQGEPVAYILGEKEFWGLKFKVCPGVLVPRPDTETLVGTLLSFIQDKNSEAQIADLGVGSGAILLSILNEFPNFKGFGIDQSEIAVKIAKENAESLGLADRAEIIKGSWAEPLKGKGKMNIIVSNPPYIRSGDMDDLQKDVKDFEPETALEAGEDGMDCYKKLIPSAYKKLMDGGLLMLEIGHDQADEVKKLLFPRQWAEVAVFKDLGDRDRVVVAIRK